MQRGISFWITAGLFLPTLVFAVAPCSVSAQAPMARDTRMDASAVPERKTPAPSGGRARALPLAPSESNVSASDPDVPDVASADKVAVKVRGAPDMSGEYRVNADATISIPVLGRVKVADVLPADLERLLADKIAALSGRDAFVTVEITEYRPVFVTGYVAKSGATPWQPGMTVLQAVAAAGGAYRPMDALVKAANGPLDVENTRVRKASAGLKVALATLARLQAEHRRAANIEMSPRLLQLAGQVEAENLIRSQQTLLDSRRVAYDNQITTMQRAMTLAEDELGGLREQTGRIQEQLRLRQDNKNKVEELQQRGIVSGPRTLEEKIKVSDLQEKQTNVSVAIARVLSASAGLKRDIAKADLERQSQLEADIGKAQSDIEQLEIDLDAGKVALAHLQQEIQSVVATEEIIGYAIVRRSPTGPLKTLEADAATPLKPGDVVMLTNQPASSSGRALIR